MSDKNKETNSAVIVVDMLNDFVVPTGSLYVPSAEKLIPRIKNILNAARDKSIQVVYVRDFHEKDDPEFKSWPPHCIAWTNGANVVDELAPIDSDLIIRKNQLSAYTSPKFRYWLNEWTEFSERNGLAQHVYVVGVATEYCVKSLIMDIVINRYPHIRAYVVSDCITGVDIVPGDVVEAIGDIAHRANFIKSTKLISDFTLVSGNVKFELQKLSEDL